MYIASSCVYAALPDVVVLLAILHTVDIASATAVQGTVNLIAAAKQAKVKKFVLVTSIGTDDPLFPLNLFFGVSLRRAVMQLHVQACKAMLL